MHSLNELLLPLVRKDATEVSDLKMWTKKPSGYYVAYHPNKNLKLFARAAPEDSIMKGKSGVRSMLRLNENHNGGHFETLMWGQSFYEDGRMEDFSAWDDSSLPYEATGDFKDWVLDMLRHV